MDARDAQLAAVHARNDELTATLTTLRMADADRGRELAELRTDLELLKAALAVQLHVGSDADGSES